MQLQQLAGSPAQRYHIKLCIVVNTKTGIVYID